MESEEGRGTAMAREIIRINSGTERLLACLPGKLTGRKTEILLLSGFSRRQKRNRTGYAHYLQATGFMGMGLFGLNLNIVAIDSKEYEAAKIISSVSHAQTQYHEEDPAN